jgi:hypothetical protein
LGFLFVGETSLPPFIQPQRVDARINLLVHLRLKDPDDAFERLIPRACEFTDEGRTAGGVLGHCPADVSRSAATVLTSEEYETARKAIVSVFVPPDSPSLPGVQ